MYKFKAYLALVIIGLFFLIPFAIFAIHFEKWSLVILGILVLSVIILFADYFVLSIINVRQRTKKNEAVIDKVNNISVFNGISNIQIFFSDGDSFEIIAIDSFRRNSASLILGEALISSLSSSELHSIISEALLKIRKKEAAVLVTIVAITSIMKFPFSILEVAGKLKLVGGLFSIMRSFILLFIYPLLLIEKQIIAFIKNRVLSPTEDNICCEQTELAVAVSKLISDKVIDSSTIVGFARTHLNMFMNIDNKSLIEMCRSTDRENSSFFGVKSEKGC